MSEPFSELQTIWRWTQLTLELLDLVQIAAKSRARAWRQKLSLIQRN